MLQSLSLNVSKYTPSNHTLLTLSNFGKVSTFSNNNKRIQRQPTETIYISKIKSTKPVVKKQQFKINPTIQKQNLLFQIEKQSKKLKEQCILHQKLKFQLEKNELKGIKKKLIIKKAQQNIDQSMKQKENQQKNKKFKAIQNQNLLQSISCQIEILQCEYQNNLQQITKVKHSKKYTRFLQVFEQKNISEHQLDNIKKHLKSLKQQISCLKKQRKQNRERKISQILMEGQMQDNIEYTNIKLYQQIQNINQQARSMAQKKVQLLKLRENLFKDIQRVNHINTKSKLNHQYQYDKFIQNYSSKVNQQLQEKSYNFQSKDRGQLTIHMKQMQDKYFCHGSYGEDFQDEESYDQYEQQIQQDNQNSYNQYFETKNIDNINKKVNVQEKQRYRTFST